MAMIYVCAAKAMINIGEYTAAKRFLWQAYSQCNDPDIRVNMLKLISAMSGRRENEHG
jgi:hypothetical protein